MNTEPTLMNLELDDIQPRTPAPNKVVTHCRVQGVDRDMTRGNPEEGKPPRPRLTVRLLPTEGNYSSVRHQIFFPVPQDPETTKRLLLENMVTFLAAIGVDKTQFQAAWNSGQFQPDSLIGKDCRCVFSDNDRGYQEVQRFLLPGQEG